MGGCPMERCSMEGAAGIQARAAVQSDREAMRGRLTGWMGALKPTTRRIGRTPAPHTCPRHPAHDPRPAARTTAARPIARSAATHAAGQTEGGFGSMRLGQS